MINNSFDRIANENKTLGVEFTDGKVKLIQFQRSGETYVLRSFAEKELPEGSFEGNKIIDTVTVGEMLAKEMSEAQPQRPDTTYVICLIPQRDIFLITQEIPLVSAEEAQSVLENKIGDLIPMAAADVYWDWRIITQFENKMQVQIAASPKDLIDSYMRCFEEAKLVPLIFEPTAEAASRVGGTSAIDENLLLLMLDEKSAIVSITRNQSVVFSTDIPLEISPSGEVNTTQLINRVQEIIAYIQQQSRQKFVFNTNARIYGKTTMVDKVLKALSTVDSKYKFSRIRYQKSEKNRISEFIPFLDEYVPLVGAAIRGLPNFTETASSINLVPEEAKKAFSKKQIKNTVSRYSFFFMMDAVLILIAMFVLSMRASRELVQVQSILDKERKQSEVPIYVELKQNIVTLNKQTVVINNINSQLYAWDRAVVALSEITPADIRLELVRLAPNPDKKGRYEVHIEGAYDNRLSTIEFSNRMRELPYFEEVALPLGSLEQVTEGNFVITGLINVDALLKINDPVQADEVQEVSP